MRVEQLLKLLQVQETMRLLQVVAELVELEVLVYLKVHIHLLLLPQQEVQEAT
jgi:hypothetical protein